MGLERQLEEKIREHEVVLEEIREADPEAYALTHVDPKSIPEIQRILSPDERLVEFFAYSVDEVGACILDHDGLSSLAGSDAI